MYYCLYVIWVSLCLQSLHLKMSPHTTAMITYASYKALSYRKVWTGAMFILIIRLNIPRNKREKLRSNGYKCSLTISGSFSILIKIRIASVFIKVIGEDIIPFNYINLTIHIFENKVISPTSIIRVSVSFLHLLSYISSDRIVFHLYQFFIYEVLLEFVTTPLDDHSWSILNQFHTEISW